MAIGIDAIFNTCTNLHDVLVKIEYLSWNIQKYDLKI